MLYYEQYPFRLEIRPPQWKSLRAVRALFCLLIITACLAGAASAEGFSGGDGSSGSPYLISSESDLQQLATGVNGGTTYADSYFKLTQNIILNGEWTPIGNNQNSFSGTFDGADHTVSGLSITNSGTGYLGLFGLNKGTIKNLNVDGKIEVVSSDSSLNIYAGGIVGDNLGGTIENCSSNVIVNVTGENIVYAGGLVGYSRSSASVTNCSAAGDVTAVKGSANNNNNVVSPGGLVGFSESSSISQSYAVGNVTASLPESGTYTISLYAGGLVGQQKGLGSEITNCFFAGKVTAGEIGSRYVGGLVGELESSAQISNSYAVGTATEGQHAGGLVGYAGSNTAISNSYALNKEVSGTSSTTGRIFGGQHGNSKYAPSLSGNSAWKDMVGGSASGSATNKNGAPISSEAVWNNAETFPGWDSNIWEMNNDDTYKLPVLKALAKPAYDASYLDPDAGKVQVTYNANGGEGTVPVDETKYTVGTEVEVRGSETLNHVPKSFAGWNTKADGSGKNYVAGDKFTISADTTLYANWTTTPVIYKVTYDANGATSGAVPTDITEYNPGNNKVTVEYSNDLAKTGYYFNGWNTQADGKGANYGGPNEERTFTISEDTTLYAKWSPILYGVNFHSNADTATPESPVYREFDYDKEYDIPCPFTNPGNILLGWADEENGDVKYAADESGTVKLKNLTTISRTEGVVILYAVWEGETYTVSFEANYGTAEGTMNPVSGIPYGQEYTLPECGFTTPGYTLAYWTTCDSESTTHTLYPGDKYRITEDTVFRAQWTEAQVTITFDTQGGTEISPISGKYTEQITTPDYPTKTGYIFDKWEPALPNVLPKTDTTYVAQWKPITYTVFYDENNGDGVKTSQVFEYNVSEALTVNPDSITAPSGKEFNGWNTKADGTGTSYPADYSASKMTTENGAEITLYAQWKDISGGNDGSDSDSDYDDYEPWTPSTPSKPSKPSTPTTPEVPDVPKVTDETKEISVSEENTETLPTGDKVIVVALENTKAVQSVAVPEAVAQANPGASVKVTEGGEAPALPESVAADNVHIVVGVSVVDKEGNSVKITESGYFILDADVPAGKKLVVGHYKNDIWVDCLVENLGNGQHKVHYNGLSPFAAVIIEEHEESPFTAEEKPTEEPAETPAPILGMVLGGLAAAVVLRRK